jgi:uncharacterized protein YkwD
MPTSRGRVPALLLALLLTPAGTAGCLAVETRSPTGTGAVIAPSPESPPTADADAPAEQRMARALFDRVNVERENRGLEPVEWNDALAEVARAWSADMAGTGRLEHQDVQALLERDELSGFTGIGENVFTASAPVPAGVAHVGWMRSDGHRANVLNPGWNRLGVGVFCADDGSVWATQQFGRTVDADRPSVSRATPPAEPIAAAEEDGPTCP